MFGVNSINESCLVRFNAKKFFDEKFREKLNEKNPMGDKCSESVQKCLSETAATNRFADYFVICGLDLNEGLEPDRFAGE